MILETYEFYGKMEQKWIGEHFWKLRAIFWKYNIFKKTRFFVNVNIFQTYDFFYKKSKTFSDIPPNIFEFANFKHE